MMKSDLLEFYSSAIKEKLTKKLYIIYLIVILFLIFFFRKLGTADVLEVLKSINLGFLALACLFYGFSLLVRGYRFYSLVSAIKKVDLGNILSIQSISQTIAIYTTALAELIKSVPLKITEGLTVKKTAKVFVFEKTLDIFVKLIILVLAVPYLSNFFPAIANKLVFVAIFGVIFIVAAGGYVLKKKFNKIPVVYTLKVVGLSFGICFLQMIGIYFVFLSLNVTVPYHLIFIIYVIIAVVSGLAMLPLGLGIKEPLLVLVSQTAVSLSEGGAFTILINVIFIVTYTTLSIIFLLYYLNRRKNGK